MIYSWQTKIWQQFWRSKQENNLAHAWLLCGLTGTGKRDFAEHITQAFLCAATDSEGNCCNTCHACRLVQTGTHPNIFWLQPEKIGQAIKIDQVRAAKEFVDQSALQGDHRFVLIHPANSMNINAANALLKTLEEPSSGAILILICDQPTNLPATIISRCQQIKFTRPATEEALVFLKDKLKNVTDDHTQLLDLVQGGPLAVCRLVDENKLSVRNELFQHLSALAKKNASPLKVAATIHELDTILCLDFMLSWIMDLIRLQLHTNKSELTDAVVTNKDYLTTLKALQPRTSIKKNIKYMNHLQHFRSQITAGLNLNRTLIMENILLQWMECVND